MRVSAVIGAGYGDEGKGLMTDALCALSRESGERVKVVRFNGGAQAGHTVQLKDGRRHVFHHHGAGILAGAGTHLSRFFTVLPVLALKERQTLSMMRCDVPALRIARNAPITTPFDILINHGAEIARGGAKHGSCGLGFGETWERHENGPVFTLKDIWSKDRRDILMEIHDEWMTKRIATLGFDPSFIPSHDVLSVINRFEQDLEDFKSIVRLVDDEDMGEGCDHILFEGAQGLLLDQDLGHFPHVTRSHTGMPNIETLMSLAGLDGLNAWWMSRCYKTRHGAGPLEGECSKIEGVSVKDMTNQPNEWQDSLRIAPLCLSSLIETIEKDIQRVDNTLFNHKGIAMTCLDQVEGDIKTMQGDKRKDDFGFDIMTSLNFDRYAQSFGPTRESVVFY